MRTAVGTVILSLFSLFSIGSGQNVSTLLSTADGKYELNDFQGNHGLLKKAEAVEPENVDVLWRLARSHFDLSDNTDNPELTEKNVYAGFDYARRTLEKDPDNAKGHKWYGILIGRVGEIEGTEQKIRNSYHVAEHTLRAIELDPEDDGTYHVMGRWHYSLADLNWFERTIASLVYATPPEATFEEAKEYFIKAIEIEPRDIRHLLWLGKTQVRLGDDVGARASLNRTLSIEPESGSDRLLQREARNLLKDL